MWADQRAGPRRKIDEGRGSGGSGVGRVAGEAGRAAARCVQPLGTSQGYAGA